MSFHKSDLLIETVGNSRSRIETVIGTSSEVRNLKQNLSGFCFSPWSFTVSITLFHDLDLKEMAMEGR